MRPIAVLLLAAAIPLYSQDSGVGLRAHLIVPMSDLRDLTDGQIGIGAAGFITIPVMPGIVFRPLVGFQYIPKGDTLGLAGTKTQVSSADLMLDALWFPGEDTERGTYLVGSVGGQMWRISSSGTSSSDLTATRLGLSGGIGYQYTTRLGFEARGFWSPIDKAVTGTGLMLCATVRF